MALRRDINAETEAAFVMTECRPEPIRFHALGSREVRGEFDGGDISSDAGGLLLREVEKRTGIVERLADCFRDYRDPRWVEHSVEQLVAQRVYGLCLGYEDLNDHDELRADPLLAVLVEQSDPKGGRRKRARDRGQALAGKSTLNRLELSPREGADRQVYKKIGRDEEAMDRLMVDVFLEAHPEEPAEIILDLDATDDPVHGSQEGRFFHGYYGHYCYLPLYIFCGEFLLGARLRSSNIDAAAGSVEELERIVGQIRAKWRQVHIIIRADSGFCRDEILSWCEARPGVDYVIGLAKNSRLIRTLEPDLDRAEREFRRTGEPARCFRDFSYRTRQSWARSRRVIGKAEHLARGANPRFIVTSLPKASHLPADLYERVYCARGDMENRIKEQQLGLFADRTSTATMQANQLRLYFSSFACILMQALRRLALQGTELARAQCSTIRLKLLKIGAEIRVTVRRVWIRMASGYPGTVLFRQILANLQMIPLRC
jgi:Transposase DDE domain group 1